MKHNAISIICEVVALLAVALPTHSAPVTIDGRIKLCSLAMDGRVSLERINLAPQLAQYMFASTKPQNQDIHDAVNDIALFLTFDNGAFNLYSQLVRNYFENFNGEHKNRFKTEKLVKELIQYIIANIKTSISKNQLEKMLNPVVNSPELVNVHKTLIALSNPHLTTHSPSDVNAPIDYQKVSSAPAGVQKQSAQVYNFVFLVGRQLRSIQLTRIVENIYVTTAHVWQNLKGKNNDEAPLLFQSINMAQSIPYSVHRLGKAAPDENFMPHQIQKEALDDLVTFFIGEANEQPQVITSDVKLGEPVYFLTQPSPPVQTQSHFIDKTNLKVSSGKIIGMQNGLVVAEMPSSNGDSGLPVYDQSGALIGLTWASRTFRRTTWTDLQYRLYQAGSLAVEREYTYIIPVSAVFNFLNASLSTEVVPNFGK